MHRHKIQTQCDNPSRNWPEDDRASVVIGLLAASISGFFVGLLTRGEFACATAVGVLVPATNLATWQLRTALARGSCEAPCTPADASDAKPSGAAGRLRTRRQPPAQGERQAE